MTSASPPPHLRTYGRTNGPIGFLDFPTIRTKTVRRQGTENEQREQFDAKGGGCKLTNSSVAFQTSQQAKPILFVVDCN